jgi:hypothetical protein
MSCIRLGSCYEGTENKAAALEILDYLFGPEEDAQDGDDVKNG